MGSCKLMPAGIADYIVKLLIDEKGRVELGCAAAKKQILKVRKSYFLSVMTKKVEENLERMSGWLKSELLFLFIMQRSI